jgi:thiol-disulfide isomerase/thioredoxin
MEIGLNRWMLGFTCLLASCASSPGTATVPTDPTTAVAAVAANVSVLPPVTLHKTAPNVTFLDASLKSHALDEFKGKFVVLAFFAHWCGVCQKEMPVLQQFATDFKGQNAVVIPIEATGATPDIVKAFADLVSPGMTLYHDPGQAAPKAYLVERFPTLYFISSDFMVQEQVQGAVPEDYLKARYTLYGGAGAPAKP